MSRETFMHAAERANAAVNLDWPYTWIMAKKTQALPKNFEEGMRELETILSDIERGEMGVEDSLVRYERGAFLIQHCRGVLNKAQLQIEALAKAPAEAEIAADPEPVEEQQ